METATRDLLTNLFEEMHESITKLINVASAANSTSGLRAKTVSIFKVGDSSLVWPRQNPKNLDMKLSGEASRLYSVSLMNRDRETDSYSITDIPSVNYSSIPSTRPSPNWHTIPGTRGSSYRWSSTSLGGNKTVEDGEFEYFVPTGPKGRNLLIYKIADLTKGNPKRTLQTIGNIRRIQDWCNERISGLRRLLDNNHLQQAKARSQLGAEEIGSVLGAGPASTKLESIVAALGSMKLNPHNWQTMPNGLTWTADTVWDNTYKYPPIMSGPITLTTTKPV